MNGNTTSLAKDTEASFPILDVSDDESELPWAMYRSLDPAYVKNDPKESESWELDSQQEIAGDTE